MSLDEFLQILVDLVQRYIVIIAILGALSLVLIAIRFINELARFIGYITKFFKLIFLGIYYFFKYILLFLKFIFIDLLIVGSVNFIKTLIYHYRLRHSIFNIYPVSYKFNFLYKLFSRKLRKQLKFRYNLLEQCEKSKDQIQNKFSYLVFIEAAVGGGKTSFINGYSHMRTVLFKEQISDTLLSVEVRYHDFSFHSLRKRIKELYDAGFDESRIMTILYRDPIIDSEFNKNKLVTDYVTTQPAPIILKTYTLAYMAELRDNFIISNYKIFNRITEKYNYELTPDFFNIKNPESRKRFYLPPYTLICDDESALGQYKNTSDYRAINDMGADIVFRLFRQLRNQTNYYISSTQNTSRIAPLIRELANSYIRILSCEIVGNLPGWQSKIRKKENKLEKKILKKYSKIARNNPCLAELWMHSENKFKTKLFKLWDKKKKVTAAAFLRYKVRISSKLEDLRDPNNYKEINVVYPLSWCWGVYRTCEYSDFYEFIQKDNKNILTDASLNEIHDLYTSNDDKFNDLLKSSDVIKEEQELKKAERKNRIKKKIEEETRKENK